MQKIYSEEDFSFSLGGGGGQGGIDRARLTGQVYNPSYRKAEVGGLQSQLRLECVNSHPGYLSETLPQKKQK